MNKTYLLGILIGITAALLLNVGKGVQKQKVRVFLTGRLMIRRSNRRDLGIWSVGFLMTAFSIPPYVIALRLTGSPSTVGALTGVGLLGLTAYALTVIGERMNRVDAAGVALVVVGTLLLGVVGREPDLAARAFEAAVLRRSIGILLACCVAGCILALFVRRVHGLAFGLTAGACIGCAFFLLDAGLVRSGDSVRAFVGNRYPLVAVFGFGTLAMVITQLAFLRGRALEVVPAINSATIIAPLILEMGIYSVYPSAFRAMVVAVILVGVVLLSIGSAARAGG